MSLNWARVEYNQVENCEGEVLYEIKLIRDGKFTRLYAKEYQDLMKWKIALKRVCVQTDIKERFRLVKFIGEGSFGEVNFLLKISFLIFFFSILNFKGIFFNFYFISFLKKFRFIKFMKDLKKSITQ